MKPFVAIIVFLMAMVAVGQEIKHAQAVSQCRADEHKWSSMISTSIATPLKIFESMTYAELMNAMSEMDECVTTDPENSYKYTHVGDGFAIMGSVRTLSYITRHGLYGDFLAEDAAGKR